MKEAILWECGENRKVNCKLCSWRCSISPDNYGICGVRKNIDGTLYSLNYDKVCAANPDPIEKKPLFHFYPGTRSFSIAAPGCNFKCEFCQNWQISQVALEQGHIEGSPYSPQEIVQTALASGCKSIAYTYTEPTIFMELCNDCGKLADQKGLANVFVSNGYMTIEAIETCKDWLDAINIDLKAFSEDYYKSLCKGRLQPVLDSIRHIAKETDIWMELTTLLIPDENDSDEELQKIADFIVQEAGPHVPWHVSRFYPNYQMGSAKATPPGRLEKALEIGHSTGLQYIYVGNLPGSRAESTLCHSCGQILIERMGYRIVSSNLTARGTCPDCDTPLAGVGLNP